MPLSPIYGRIFTKWMDGWPAMETDAGRAVMKTPATKAKDLFKVVLPTPVATTLSISRAVDNHLATKYSKWSACHGRSLPVLYWYPSPISPTEPVSIAQLVRRSLGHSPSHISSRPSQAPTRIRTRAYNFFQKLRVKNSSALDHSAKLFVKRYLKNDILYMITDIIFWN